MDIKKQREQVGITQKQLADLVQCDVRTIQRYEAAPEKVPAPMLELMRIKLSDLHYDQNEAAKEEAGVGSCSDCGDDYTDMPNSGGLCHDCYTGQSRFEYEG